ncbi:MAG TPA: hypothetical protein VMT64_14465, partial [Candidatus Binataceae bacterium]|nr:hypothetical protein [Candidatus Binataceae bacterium]
MARFGGLDISRLLSGRLAEPLHLNLAAAFVGLFGSYRSRVAFDVVRRPEYALGMLQAADRAGSAGLRRIIAIEFGVASGAGLLAMCRIAEETTRCTGVAIEIVGFDGGVGLPAPIDYRDHPDLWIKGDYPMPDRDRLLRALPPNARIIFGPLTDTVPRFVESMTPDRPIGFASVDVDLYSSAHECLQVFAHP